MLDVCYALSRGGRRRMEIMLMMQISWWARRSKRGLLIGGVYTARFPSISIDSVKLNCQISFKYVILNTSFDSDCIVHCQAEGHCCAMLGVRTRCVVYFF